MTAEALESSKSACERLEVSPQTLYAYVSRGLIRVEKDSHDSRKSLYFSEDIDALLSKKKLGRSRRSVAASTIHFGEPILPSKLTRIEGGEFYYKGRNATELSRELTLEETFDLLCGAHSSNYAAASRQLQLPQLDRPIDRMLSTLASEVTSNSRHGDRREAYRLLQVLSISASGSMKALSEDEVHNRLASAWSLSEEDSDIVRRALVLCADHELNASAYATRIAASAGASLAASLLAGLATLSGARHGGLTDMCRDWMRDAAKETQSELSKRISDLGAPPPGFGHPLYPSGDPRARELLSYCRPPRKWSGIATLIKKKYAAKPNLDFALATIEARLDLPKGSGLAIFAIGRCVGWAAHTFEQRRFGRIIRPRAHVEE